VLKDPTEDFLDEEESKVIDFITDPDMPWALVVVSKSDKWKSKCNRFFFMDNGTMSIKE
jgi:predicted ABC-type transport system involved in lysophospholipase L1 biosynthesis ATPase subunit